MEQSLSFCDFTDHELSALTQALATVFSFSPADLPVQYDRWRSTFFTGARVADIPLTFQSQSSKFQKFVESSEVVGVDLPITLTSLEAAPTNQTVMIIAQDPKRDADTQRCGQITLGTPFALHIPWGRYTGQYTRLLFQAVQLWLAQGWRAYLTDVIKLYAFDQEREKARNLLKLDRDKFYTLLAAEIEIFQPSAIVTIGASAHRAIQYIRPDVKLIAVPHFSGSNQAEWKNRLESGQRITNDAKLTWYREQVAAAMQ